MPDSSQKMPDTQTWDSIDQETEPLQIQDKEDSSQPRYHRYSISLFAIYIPLISVPWALTCVMSKRPIGASSYHNQRGLSDKEMQRIETWTTAINVLNSIGSLVTIPILSALIAQAAVVHSEKHVKRQDFHMKHLVALADRGWTNPFILGTTWGWKGCESTRVRSLLHFASTMIILGALQQPLYQILVPMESILVPTCQDTSPMRSVKGFYRNYGDCKYNPVAPRLLGWDMEPEQQGEPATFGLQHLVPQLIGEIATAGVSDVKMNLWANISTPMPEEQILLNLNSENFVASLAQGTTTGVLRQHIMRLNSSVSCQRITRAEFPSQCAGRDPFTRSFQHGGNITRVCVPGYWGMTPWTQSRSRQDISEELYIDSVEQLQLGRADLVGFMNYTSDFTLRCTANTTRGYFELGNYRNNFTWGPLLEQWPSKKDLTENYNDFHMGLFIPEDPNSTSQEPIDPYMSSRYVSGPLTNVAVAIFGNNTFFDMGTKAWNESQSQEFSWKETCTFLPFGQLDPPSSGESYWDNLGRFPICERETRDSTRKEAFAKWLHGFNDTQGATKAISTAVYLANEAVVTADKWLPNFKAGGGLRNDRGRLIYLGSGTTIRKPQISITALTMVSFIIFLELVALGLLAWLIYRGPSRTRSLDAIAFTRIKKIIEER